VSLAVLDVPAGEELDSTRRVRHSLRIISRKGRRSPMPEDSFDARELLEAIANRRDRTAFGRLVDHFAPRLRAFLRRGGASEAEIEDIVQEAMLKVWRRAEQFDAARGGASTWILV
jgi:RNA polymerase sigma-70 factor (ECF subfamily)